MKAFPPFRPSRILTVAAAAALIGLTGCAGGDSGSGDNAASAQGGAPAQSGAEPASPGGFSRDGSAEGGSGQGGTDAGGKASPGSGAVDPARLAAPSDYLVRNAMLALRVKSISAAAGQVRAVSAAHGGMVLSENIGGSSGDIVPLDDPSRVTATTYGEVTISVPAAELDETVGELSRIGTVLRRESGSQNVHDQYVDTESRIKTMRASVDRVRALMARATDIGQIVTLEAELSRRQADLEALESQLASLEDQIAQSPVRVSLTTDSGVIAEDPGTGFLAGLKGGWEAFTASVVVVLTVLGAVLPFAVALAAIGLPVWLVVRRRRVQPPSTTAVPPAAPPAAAAAP